MTPFNPTGSQIPGVQLPQGGGRQVGMNVVHQPQAQEGGGKGDPIMGILGKGLGIAGAVTGNPILSGVGSAFNLANGDNGAAASQAASASITEGQVAKSGGSADPNSGGFHNANETIQKPPQPTKPAESEPASQENAPRQTQKTETPAPVEGGAAQTPQPLQPLPAPPTPWFNPAMWGSGSANGGVDPNLMQMIISMMRSQSGGMG